jgi:AhpD family alkylhydroperoxidase
MAAAGLPCMNTATSSTDTNIARIAHVEPAEATGRTKELLDGVSAQFGVVPNGLKTMAGSTVLEGYLGFAGALARGRIRRPVAERIAIAVANFNKCAYCLSAHSYVAEHALRIEADEIQAAREFSSADPKTAATLAFAHAVAVSRGKVGDEVVEAAFAAGLADAELAETVGHVALNILTNYFHKTFEVEVDYPLVEPV